MARSLIFSRAPGSRQTKIEFNGRSKSVAYTEALHGGIRRIRWLQKCLTYKPFFYAVGLPTMQQPTALYKHRAAPASVTGSDECAQLVVNLALALLGCHLQTSAISKLHIRQATENLLRLSLQGCTVRAIGVTKMVHLASQGFGVTETVFLPIVDDVLLLPSVDMKKSASLLHTSFLRSQMIHFTDIGITYHRLRIRTERLKHALVVLADMEASPAAGTLIKDILAQCLYPGAPPASVLDQTDDYLTLALNFMRLGNYPLAGVAVAKAESTLHGYTWQSNTSAHTFRADKIMANLAGLRHMVATLAS
jgi:hypothetical protein